MRKSAITILRSAQPRFPALRAAVVASCATILSLPSPAQECLRILVVDPAGAAVTTATVSLGDQEQPTDDNGLATLCGLGSGPNSLVIQAPGLQTLERSVQQTTGTLTFTLPLETVQESIEVVGSRVAGREYQDAAVPVQLVLGERLRTSGQTETGRALQMLAPSFNYSKSAITDGTDSVRPATLRGLGPDQTLVLINGKRRHQSALLHVLDSVGRGTAGTDIDAIPIAAIERIEVLRDGAAAQYGSDAIAGVINIVLKQSDQTTLETAWGQTYRGDGGTSTNTVNTGFVGDNGSYANLTFESRLREHTNRSGAWGWPFWNPVDCAPGQEPSSAGFCLDPRESTQNRNVIRLGDAEIRHHGFFVNAAHPLGDNANFYAFGGAALRDNKSPGFYRVPFVFNERIVYELHPEGFLPFIETDVDDYSFVAGVDWTLASGWTFDLSVGHGRNSFDFEITNSNNASYGATSPTSARAGGLRFDQTTVNFDVSRLFEYSGRTMNLAFGAEFRRDGFGILAGEPFSYLHCVDDPSADPATCRPDAPPGIQVFPGYRPSDETSRDRTNSAAYADVEWGFGGKFLLNLAGRFERYSDFGGTVIGKLSARYDFTPSFAVRGGVNTGFRAPSLHQLYYSKVDTLSVESADGSTVLAEVGTFPNDSQIVQSLGIPPLKEETSLNFSGGLLANLGPSATLSVDAFRVRVDDRIVLTANITADQVEPLAPEVARIMREVRLSGGQFFANAVQTVTNGVEFTFNSVHALRGGSVVDWGVSGSYFKTEVGDDGIRFPETLSSLEEILFEPADIGIIEDHQPNTRIQASGEYRIGRIRAGGTLRYFGEYRLWDALGLIARSRNQVFSGKWLTDLHFGVRLAKGLDLTVGAENVFNVFPDENEYTQLFGTILSDIAGAPFSNLTPAGGSVIPGTESRGIFPQARYSPFGINGGYYYSRLSLRF